MRNNKTFSTATKQILPHPLADMSTCRLALGNPAPAKALGRKELFSYPAAACGGSQGAPHLYLQHVEKQSAPFFRNKYNNSTTAKDRHQRTTLFKKDLRQHLEQTFSSQELKRWYDPLALHVCQDTRQLDVRFPHAFFSTWFAENVQGRFEEQLNSYFGPGYVIQYSQGNGNHSPQDNNTPRLSPAKRIDFPFDSQYTFDRFLVNKKNYFPLASAKEVSTQKNILFNPFIICGESGSGKTHLLRAIGNELSKSQDSESIFLGSMEDISQIFNSNGNNSSHMAREKFFAYDALLVDDFHLIKNHPHLQNDFIVLFNHFYEHKKQMIVVCPQRITHYEFLDPTLKSRLEWGLIVTLKKPDFDIRIKYIRNQCRQKKMKLDSDQEITLAQRFNDFRSLQGILIKFSPILNCSIAI